jgi:hypothetical protein
VLDGFGKERAAHGELGSSYFEVVFQEETTSSLDVDRLR